MRAEEPYVFVGFPQGKLKKFFPKFKGTVSPL
jgi:hypothetical protein